jgi:hypothetical protein
MICKGKNHLEHGQNVLDHLREMKKFPEALGQMVNRPEPFG